MPATETRAAPKPPEEGTRSRSRVRSDHMTEALEDVFLHLRTCSRELEQLAPDDKDEDDRSVTRENAVSDKLADLTLAAVECVRAITRNGALPPGDLHNLEMHDVDDLCRPIFEASGIGDDFMPASERFPDYRPEEDDDGDH